MRKDGYRLLTDRRSTLTPLTPVAGRRNLETRRKEDPMLRRIALGVLAAVAAAGLAAAVQPAAATPGGETVAPAISGPGAHPALTPIAAASGNAPSTVQDHGFLVCPPPANYDPGTAQ
jgi:hypothetical protein